MAGEEQRAPDAPQPSLSPRFQLSRTDRFLAVWLAAAVAVFLVAIVWPGLLEAHKGGIPIGAMTCLGLIGAVGGLAEKSLRRAASGCMALLVAGALPWLVSFAQEGQAITRLAPLLVWPFAFVALAGWSVNDLRGRGSLPSGTSPHGGWWRTGLICLAALMASALLGAVTAFFCGPWISCSSPDHPGMVLRSAWPAASYALFLTPFGTCYWWIVARATSPSRKAKDAAASANAA